MRRADSIGGRPESASDSHTRAPRSTPEPRVTQPRNWVFGAFTSFGASAGAPLAASPLAIGAAKERSVGVLMDVDVAHAQIGSYGFSSDGVSPQYGPAPGPRLGATPKLTANVSVSAGIIFGRGDADSYSKSEANTLTITGEDFVGLSVTYLSTKERDSGIRFDGFAVAIVAEAAPGISFVRSKSNTILSKPEWTDARVSNHVETWISQQSGAGWSEALRGY